MSPALGFVPTLQAQPWEGPGLWFCIGQGEILVEDGPAGVALPEAFDPPGLGVRSDTAAHLLGSLGGRPCWCVGALQAGAGQRWVPLRALYGLVPDPVWAVAGRAVQIVEWERTHRYCGRCATPTVARPDERARSCPACGLLAFPRLAPAVIVLIERAGRILLARGRNFDVPMYSALAGFVEPGETLEEAVHREVAEEVGVRLGRLRYFASQPWPFPHSLMIGFTADWAGQEIVIDGREILDAGWFGPRDLPLLPPPMSIARHMIDDYLSRQPSLP